MNAKLWIELGKFMEYSSSLAGYCSASPQVPPTPGRHLNRPYRLPLSHPFSPQGQLFTMPRRLSIDCIELQRTPYKKPKTCWKQFSNMRAKPSLDISAAERFRIVKDGCLAATIASTM